MLVKIGNGEILDVLGEESALDDEKTRETLKKVTKQTAVESNKNLSKDGNNSEK